LTQDKLPKQTLGGNNTWDEDTDLNSLGNGGTVANGGNATDGEGWADALTREIANRYVTSVFCSWYATGGSIPNLLPRLDNSTLNLTNSANDSGHLYEKFSALDVDNAGTGGEYAVQAGFGWTNGVLLWIVSKWGDKLVRPTCPNVTLEVSGNQDAAASAAFSVTLGGSGYGWMGVWVTVMVTLASGLLV
jgi:alpha,alpha-trehalase